MAKTTDKTTAVVIDTDGTITPVVPSNTRDFKLDELYMHTASTTVQMIYLPDGRIMWMDEEGKFNGKEPNPKATALTGGTLMPGDYIAGKVLVCPSRMVK